jgi:hypothetical protein
MLAGWLAGCLMLIVLSTAGAQGLLTQCGTIKRLHCWMQSAAGGCWRLWFQVFALLGRLVLLTWRSLGRVMASLVGQFQWYVAMLIAAVVGLVEAGMLTLVRHSRNHS